MRIALSFAAALAAAGALSAQAGSFTTSGTGCPTQACLGANAIYELLATGAWDLDGSSITFTPAPPTYMAVAQGAPLTLTAGAQPGPTTDDTVGGPYPVGFTFPYLGGVGTTTMVDIAPNGYLYLEAGTNTSTRYPVSGALNNFLTATPSVAVLGTDLNASSTGGGVIHYETLTAANPVSMAMEQVFVVEWLNVPEYVDGGSNTVQGQLWQGGEITICHVTTNGATSTYSALVGVSTGNQTTCAAATGGIDFSTALPFAPTPPFGEIFPISLSASGTLVPGGTFTITANDLPPLSNAASLQFASGIPPAPLPLSVIGAPVGCDLQVDPIFYSGPMTTTPPTASLGVTTPLDPGSVGLTIRLQAFVADLSQAGTYAIPVFVSNVGTLTLGAIPPSLRFVCEGSNAFTGGQGTGGFFRLESGPAASHPDIVHFQCDLTAVAQMFDTDGNLGTAPSGYFDDGNGTLTGCQNAYYGTDLTTGLVYGPPQPTSFCDPAGFTGWVPSNPGTLTSEWNTVDFDFAPGQFLPGEKFVFDCDIDGGLEAGGDILMTVTVTFSDTTTLSGTTVRISSNLSEVVLIP